MTFQEKSSTDKKTTANIILARVRQTEVIQLLEYYLAYGST